MQHNFLIAIDLKALHIAIVNLVLLKIMLYTQPVYQTGYEHLPTEILDAPIDEVIIWHDGKGRKGDDWHITLVLQGSYGIGGDYIHINFDTHDFQHGLSFSTHISYGLTEGYCYERSEQKEFFKIPFEPGTPSLTVHKFNQVVQSHIPYIGLEEIIHDENFRLHHPSVLFITAFVQRLEAMRLIAVDTLSDLMCKLDCERFDITHFYYHPDVVIPQLDENKESASN